MDHETGGVVRANPPVGGVGFADTSGTRAGAKDGGATPPQRGCLDAGATTWSSGDASGKGGGDGYALHEVYS